MIRVPVAKPPEASRRRATIVTVAFLLVGVAAAPRESLQLATSLPGAAAGIAILAGFGPRGTLSIKPWIFTTASVLAYAGALLMTDHQSGALWLNILGVAALAGAAAAAFTQRSVASIADRVEVQHRRHLHRTRWGAAWVAVGVALVLLSLRTAAVLEGTDSTEPVASTGSGATSMASAPYLPPIVVDRIEDPHITESSGLVASPSSEDVLWTHNDSGAGPWLYCLRDTGASCGRWRVDGAESVDWEAIAASGSQERGVLYIGDIGDNSAARSDVVVYEIPEPVIADPSLGAGGSTAPASVTRLVYPDGPVDAEAMIVHPGTGDLYIMAKGTGSKVSVFKAPSPLKAEVTLSRVATNVLVGPLVDRTALDVTRDGRRVVMATYGGIYELVREPGERFDQIWDNEPAVVDDSVQGQVEAVAYGSDGRTIFFTEEGERPRLWRTERL